MKQMVVGNKSGVRFGNCCTYVAKTFEDFIYWLENCQDDEVIGFEATEKELQEIDELYGIKEGL